MLALQEEDVEEAGDSGDLTGAFLFDSSLYLRIVSKQVYEWCPSFGSFRCVDDCNGKVLTNSKADATMPRVIASVKHSSKRNKAAKLSKCLCVLSNGDDCPQIEGAIVIGSSME